MTGWSCPTWGVWDIWLPGSADCPDTCGPGPARPRSKHVVTADADALGGREPTFSFRLVPWTYIAEALGFTWRIWSWQRRWSHWIPQELLIFFLELGVALKQLSDHWGVDFSVTHFVSRSAYSPARAVTAPHADTQLTLKRSYFETRKQKVPAAGRGCNWWFEHSPDGVILFVGVGISKGRDILSF